VPAIRDAWLKLWRGKRATMMREIDVAGIAIKIPIIGFGCSSLASLDRKKALLLLESAFDAGVRHFDVARYYGYGEAEGILGAFIRSRRAGITITTKFGIEPPRRTSAVRMALQAGRRFARFLPAARKVAQRHTTFLIKGNAFSVDDAKRNLEISLRELGTDYIDFYLLHDYVVGDEAPNELVAFLRSAVAEDKIRCFGLGTSFDNVAQALECQSDLCNVVQFQNSVLTRNRERLPLQASRSLIITHGALGEGYRSVLSFLKASSERVHEWSAKLGLDCSDASVISALMLNYAVEANPNGLVLFSSTDSARTTKNAKSVLEPTVSLEQVRRFAELVEENWLALTG
jgi:aryl-alcohol dehydrogenase-like predicted oxidoreductase